MKLIITILPLNEHGKTHDIPCRVKPQITIDLTQFITHVLRMTVDYSNRQNAIRLLLEREFLHWNCPIGWSIQAIGAATKEHIYYPPHEKKSVDFQLIANYTGNPIVMEAGN